MGRPRPWLAATFAVLSPGLGHVYLREWTRALLWFFTVVLAATLVVPAQPVNGIQLTDPATVVDATVAIAGEITPLGLSVLGLAVACNVLDAYSAGKRIATERARDSGEAPPVCPHCGRDLDEDLDFCHWCTTQFEQAPEATG